MALFKHAKLLEIHSQAIEAGFASPSYRSTLLTGIPVSYYSKMPIENSPSIQLISDINYLNNDGIIQDEVIPFETWLRNAAYWQTENQKRQRFFRELADGLLQLCKKDNNTDSFTAKNTNHPEKIIFENDLIGYDFFLKAQKTGSSIARLIVSRFDRTLSNRKYYGTGWLIGKNLLITNYHVLNARDNNEMKSSPFQLEKQAENALIQFDFDFINSVITEFSNTKVVAFNEVLDYIILRLPVDALNFTQGTRRPLLISDNLNSLSDSRTFANIIQHPRGGPKQASIRNNILYQISESEITYFSDTEAGSSGSPVCDDSWCVIALHKASTMSYKQVEFQGKSTSWVNIGTRIDVILNDLRKINPELENEFYLNKVE